MSNIPTELKYTKSHEWTRDEGATVTVGITQHAQELLGELVFVELPKVGKEVKAMGEVAVVESVKAASDVYSPVSGKVTAVNEALVSNPGLVNEDPYGKGWLFKISPSDKSEMESLLSAQDYAKVEAE